MGAYSAPSDLLDGFKGPTSKVTEGTEGRKGRDMGREVKGEGREERGEGGEGTSPSRIGKVKSWQAYCRSRTAPVFAIVDLWSVHLLGTVLVLLFLKLFLPLVKLKHRKIANISSCNLDSVLAMQYKRLWSASWQ